MHAGTLLAFSCLFNWTLHSMVLTTFRVGFPTWVHLEAPSQTHPCSPGILVPAKFTVLIITHGLWERKGLYYREELGPWVYSWPFLTMPLFVAAGSWDRFLLGPWKSLLPQPPKQGPEFDSGWTTLGTGDSVWTGLGFGERKHEWPWATVCRGGHQAQHDTNFIDFMW